MSAIGGIVGINGAEVNAENLLLLGQGLNERGPDGGNDVYLGSVAMIHRSFHTNRHSRREKQPLIDASERILAWDGRLDNREELVESLSHERSNDQTDVSIVLAAFDKWGIDFLRHVVGDFALSLWDPKLQTLFLARDPVGTRLLFYHVNDERIIWSTRLEPLLSLPEIELEIDDEYVAGYFTTQSSSSQTPYKNIFAVPPAHVLIAHGGQIRLKRFWGLDPNKKIRYRTDAEYEEHFSSLFREAVRTRLRVDGPVWADLSGGLDSSSIVCMADSIIENREAVASSVETVSAVFDESPSSDERKFISRVEAQRGQAGHHFRESEYPLLATLDSAEFKGAPNQLEMWSAYHQGVRREMRTRGVRVLLSGIGGDELLTSSADPSIELVDLLVQYKLLDLHTRLKVWSLALKKPYVATLLRHAITPALPKRIQLLHKRRLLAQSFALLDRSFITRCDLYSRLAGSTDPFGFRLPSSRGQSAAFVSVMKVISTGSLLDWDTIEISYPFTHRPLVEFLQAIPPDQWIRPGETRSLMRRSLRQYLPPEIAKRKSKGSPSEATFRALAREWPRLRLLLRDTRMVARGYVDGGALKALTDRTLIGFDPTFVSVIRLVHLELWLRALETYSKAKKCIVAPLISPLLQSVNRRERVA